MFMDLHIACQKHNKLELEYHSASKDETTQRVVEPYRLLCNRSMWYLVAFCDMRKDLRLFSLHRIRDYKLTAETFEPMPQHRLEEWLQSPLFLEHQHAGVEVAIRFDPSAARYVKEKKWHQTEKLELHKDGSCTLEFVAPSLDEVRRWVLTFGAEAEVLKPAELRSLVAADLKKALFKY
jgi:predicted DNA-binding transcriptional regulator YafY